MNGQGEVGHRVWDLGDVREVLLSGMLLLVFLQALQALVPFMDPVYRVFVTGRGFRGAETVMELTGFALGGLALLAAAVLAPRARRGLTTRAGWAVALGVMALLRVAVALAPTARGVFASAALLAATALLVLPVALDRARLRGESGTVGPGLFLALLFETAFRVLGASVDVTMVPQMPMGAVAVAVALAACAFVPPAPSREEAFHPRSGSGHRGLLTGVGLYLLVHLLGQAAPLARWLRVDHVVGAGLVAAGILVGVGVHVSRRVRPHVAWPLAFAPVLFVLALAAPPAFAPVALVLAVPAIAAVVDAVAGAFTAEARRTGGRAPRYWVAALVVFALFASASVLPFARSPTYRELGELASLALYAAAALLFVPGALLGRETRTRPRSAPRFTRAAAAVLVLVLTLPVLAFPATGVAVDGRELASTTDDLVVVTFNVHHGVGPSGRIDWLAVADVLRDLDPDIVALQEVEGGRAARGSMDGVVVLERALGMDGTFASTIGRLYGNAVLSRHPVVDAETLLLPSTAEQRGAARARVLVDDTPVDVYSVHLAFNSMERDAQGRTLRSSIEDHGVIAFVAGDFNPWRNPAAAAHLEAIGMHKSEGLAGPNPPPTFTTSNPRASIDYVYASANVTFLDHHVSGVIASDHFPVRAVARLPE